jgi:hypothetical protein
VHLRQRKDLVATSCHVETQLDLTFFLASIIGLGQRFLGYGSPCTARFLVRNSIEFPDVVRKTEVEDGISC